MKTILKIDDQLTDNKKDLKCPHCGKMHSLLKIWTTSGSKLEEFNQAKLYFCEQSDTFYLDSSKSNNQEIKMAANG